MVLFKNGMDDGKCNVKDGLVRRSRKMKIWVRMKDREMGLVR